MAVGFEGEDTDEGAVEEHAVVAHDNAAAGEIFQRLFECRPCFDFEVVSGILEEQHVGAGFQHLCQMHAAPLVARERMLRALGRARAWRRRLKNGEAATTLDIAKAEKVTDRFVSRIMRLAYLSPDALERLLVWREPPAVSVNDLITATYLPWTEQLGLSF